MVCILHWRSYVHWYFHIQLSVLGDSFSSSFCVLCKGGVSLFNRAQLFKSLGQPRRALWENLWGEELTQGPLLLSLSSGSPSLWSLLPLPSEGFPNAPSFLQPKPLSRGTSKKYIDIFKRTFAQWQEKPEEINNRKRSIFKLNVSISKTMNFTELLTPPFTVITLQHLTDASSLLPFWPVGATLFSQHLGSGFFATTSLFLILTRGHFPHWF